METTGHCTLFLDSHARAIVLQPVKMHKYVTANFALQMSVDAKRSQHLKISCLSKDMSDMKIYRSLCGISFKKLSL